MESNTGYVYIDSDSDSTQNSIENGKHCIVRFRHCDFSFEREIFLNWGKRPSSSPIRISAKKICLETNSNDSLSTAVYEQIENPVRIYGILNLTSLYQESLKTVSTKDLITIGFGVDLTCTQECVDQLEIESRQRLSDKEAQWKILQVGRICGNVFKDACHSQSKYPSKHLMSRIYHLNKSEDAFVLWQRKNFLTVRTKYERIMIKRHVNFTYRKCGLILNPKHPQFCVTPGGIVECQCCGRGIVEFYLPYEMRNEKMIYSLPCLDETDDYEFDLRKDSNFYYKIQLHMFLTETEYCDFVIWTTCDWLDIRIKRDDDFLFVKINSAKSFFLRKILPDMLRNNDYNC